jgi:hypothetical protein
LFSFQLSGSTKNTESFLHKLAKLDISSVMESCGRLGVNALAHATPVDSGLASQSWDYEVSSSGGQVQITWTNSDDENGFPVAIMLQYGYGTGTGGYVQGQDYINPAMKPVFDQIADKVWKAVTSA